mgnify:CR=1 FL=1
MILICGNGGLASTASHFTAELTGTFAFPVYIPCIDLTSNNAQLTALSNDIGYENVFAHLVNVQGKKGDTFIGLTTSHSKNILKACQVAKEKGMHVLLWDGDFLKGETTAQKQEYCIVKLHELVYNLKKEIWESLKK